MKKIAKLLCAFALVGFAACTNDTTEDLAQTPDFAGGGSVKTLTVALDGQTRVELGEKSAEGKYPVYWQEGDVLRINEGKTSAIAIHENKSVADFTFAVADADAYSVVYPYVEGLEAATEGCLPVQFAEVQNYTEGSFDAASFPLYCYAASNALDGAGLNYLAGILKFEVTGAGEVLTQVELTATEGALSGAFDVNCQTGEMTAQATASKKLTYKFPTEGLTLSTTPAVFYIAVPAGDYGTMQALFCTTDGEVAMKANVPCTGEKAVKAGVVREFKGVTFVDNSASTQGEMFEIDSEAALFEFADMCKSSTFDYAGATVTRSFAMTTEGWEPIENFSGVFEGNGNTIREITKPIFGTTNATIQNLNVFYNVTLTKQEELNWGAIARELIAEDGVQGKLINCSAIERSTLNIDFSEVSITIPSGEALDTDHVLNVGSLVGRARGAAFSGCSNYADITVTGLPTSSNGNALSYGGIVGSIGSNGYLIKEGETLTVGSMTSCKNYGNIAFNGCDRDQYSTNGAGGITGFTYDANLIKCENSGNITVNSGYIPMFFGSGITSRAEPFFYTEGSSLVFSECKNTGNINIEKLSHSRMALGGIGGYITGTAFEIRKCVNEGCISSKAETSASAGYYNQLGGIVGRSGCSIIDCTNGVEGDLTKGVITLSGTNNKAHDGVSFGAGGIGCYCHNSVNFSGLKNYGPVILDENMTNPANVIILVAGLIGYPGAGGGHLKNSTNYGPVTVTHNTIGELRVGGCAGQSHALLSNLTNEGTITVTTKAETGKSVWVGGLVAVRSDSNIMDGGTNKGAVNVVLEKSIAGESGVAGGIASCQTYCQNITNEAPINVQVNNQKSISIAGAVSYHTKQTYIISNNLFNSGDITVTGKMEGPTTTAYGLYVAGVSARTQSCLTWDRTSGDEETFASNSGDISIDVDCAGTNPIYGYVGGVTGSTRGCVIGAVNRGNITVKGDDYTLYYMGGVIARKYNNVISTYGGEVPVTNCHNYGNIISEVTGKANQYWSFGGVIGQIENGSTSKTSPTASVTNINNHGSLTVGTTNCDLSIGGLIGLNYAPLDGIEIPATAAITIGGTHATLRVGGAVGTAGGTATTGCPVPTLTGITNNAPITLLEGTKALDSQKNDASVQVGLAVGGVIGYHNMGRKYVSISDCRNKGAITLNKVITEKGGIAVGGGVGIIHSAVGSLKSSAETGTFNEADINVSGTSAAFSYIGGIVGIQTNGDADGGGYSHNSGAVTTDIAATAEYSVGGISGAQLGMLKYSKNTGAITAKGSTEGRSFIAGVIGRKSSSRFSNEVINEGAVTASVDAALVLAVGGLSGFSNNVSWDYVGSYNSGNIEIPRDATCRGDVAVGGCTGWQYAGAGTNPASAFDYYTGKAPLNNTGRIVVSGTNEHDTFVGGIHGIFMREGTCPVTVDGVTTDVPCSAGCYVAEVTYDTDGTTIISKAPAAVSHSNSGDIRFAGTTVNAYVGGVVGLQDSQETGNSTSTTAPACNGSISGEENVGEIAGFCAPADYLPFFRSDI